MNPEEAIRILGQYDVSAIQFYETDGREISWDRGHEALDMAIDALKKQIPMKPIGEHYAHMRCPSCNHRIPSGQGSSSRRRDNWCNYCGQKIDWGED